MKVMGIDTSTKTGIAVVDENKTVLFSERIEFKKATGFNRCSLIANRVMEIHAEFKPDLVVTEGYGFANAHTLAPLVEIGTCVRYFLWQEDIDFLIVPPNSLKSFVLGAGKGNGKKELMLMEVYKRWGFTSATNDEADAVGLAMFGQCALGVLFNAHGKSAVAEVLKGQPEILKNLRSLNK
jgi:crossover junction endodeoxyribonuclease RuvC